MNFTVDESYSRGRVVATPGVEGGYLGAYEYPLDAERLNDPRRIMLYGLKANLLRIQPRDLALVREGDFSSMNRYIEPIADQLGAYAVYTTCHLFPEGREIGVNVFATLYEFGPHDIAPKE